MLFRLAFLFLVLVTLTLAEAAPASIPVARSGMDLPNDQKETLGSAPIIIPARLHKALHVEEGEGEDGFSIWSRCDVEGTSTLSFTSHDLEGLTEQEVLRLREHAYHDLCRKEDLKKRKKKKKKKTKISTEKNETSAGERRFQINIDSGFRGLGISVAISFSIGIGGFWSFW
ncbi:hypothetical protein IAT40_005076 [Kwoniella sp. CBS 6097]